MGFFDRFFGKKEKKATETLQESNISKEQETKIEVPKVEETQQTKIRVKDLPRFSYTIVPKGITKSKIDKYNLYDGEDIIVIYDPLKDEELEFNVRIDNNVDYGPKIGKLAEVDSEYLFDVYSHVIERLQILPLEIYGVLKIDDTIEDKPNVSLVLSIPYDPNVKGLPIYTKVVGVTFENRQEYLKQCYIEDGLLIENNPTEEHPEAMSVTHLTTGNCIGHLKKELAKDLIAKFGQGTSFNACVTLRTIGEDDVIGCNIQIMSVNAVSETSNN